MWCDHVYSWVGLRVALGIGGCALPTVFRFLSTLFGQMKDFVYLKVKQVAYTEVAATVRGSGVATYGSRLSGWWCSYSRRALRLVLQTFQHLHSLSLNWHLSKVRLPGVAARGTLAVGELTL